MSFAGFSVSASSAILAGGLSGGVQVSSMMGTRKELVIDQAGESLIATTGQQVHGDLEGGSQRNQDSGNEGGVSKTEFGVGVSSFPVGFLFNWKKRTPVGLSGEVRGSYIVLRMF